MTKDLRDYLFRGLMFESEANKFQKAGIQIGASDSRTEIDLTNEVISPFSINRRNKALEMSRLYSLIFCFENEIRDLIRETLQENIGVNWWDSIPNRIKDHAQRRQESALKDSWLEGEKSDLLGFIDFGMLSQIMIEFWHFFETLIPSQHWLKQRMDELEKTRNFIAHNRMLLPSEFQRIYMYIADWNRVIGL